jgi:hypothetical protein
VAIETWRIRMSFTSSLRFVLCMGGLLVVLIVTAIIIFMWPWLRPPSRYRFPIPPGTILTEATAIEFSKKALTADGMNPVGMLPVPYRDIGQRREGENIYFAVNTINQNAGCIRWSSTQGEYGVYLEKSGNEIVCEVCRSK